MNIDEMETLDMNINETAGSITPLDGPMDFQVPESTYEPSPRVLHRIMGRLFTPEDYALQRELLFIVNEHLNDFLGTSKQSRVGMLPPVIFVQTLHELEKSTDEFMLLARDVLGHPNNQKFLDLFLTESDLSMANRGDLSDWLNRRPGADRFNFKKRLTRGLLTGNLYYANNDFLEYPQLEEIGRIALREPRILIIGPDERTGAAIELMRYMAASSTMEVPYVILVTGTSVPTDIKEENRPLYAVEDFDEVPDFARFVYMNRMIQDIGIKRMMVYRSDNEPHTAAAHLIGVLSALWLARDSTLAGRKLYIAGFDFAKLKQPLALMENYKTRTGNGIIESIAKTSSWVSGPLSLNKKAAMSWGYGVWSKFPTTFEPWARLDPDEFQNSLIRSINENFEKNTGDARRTLETARAISGVTNYYYKDLRASISSNYLNIMRFTPPTDVITVSEDGKDIFSLKSVVLSGKPLRMLQGAMQRWSQGTKAGADTFSDLIRINKEVASAFNTVTATYTNGMKLKEFIFIPDDEEYAVWVANIDRHVKPSKRKKSIVRKSIRNARREVSSSNSDDILSFDSESVLSSDSDIDFDL